MSDKTMEEKLVEAGKTVEEQAAKKRERAVKGSHLLGMMLEKAKGLGLSTEEKSGFVRITGAAKGRAVYVAKRGGRVDLSGFTIEKPAVVQISAEEAKQKHLGKVRGQLDFNAEDQTVLATYEDALSALSEATEETASK